MSDKSEKKPDVLVSLSKVELEKVAPLTPDRIREVLEEGKRDREVASLAGHQAPVSSRWTFRYV
jgi:hypothetical protein